MEVKFDIHDLVVFVLQDKTKYGGTIIGKDDTGYITQVGPDASDIEVIEKKSLKAIYLGRGVDELEIHFLGDDRWEIDREPYIPPPPRSIPPRWDSISMKYYHSPDDICICGCGTGGDSSSPIALIGR